MGVCNGAEKADVQSFDWNPRNLVLTQAQAQDKTDGFALIVLNQPLQNHLGVIRRVWDNGTSCLCILCLFEGRNH